MEGRYISETLSHMNGVTPRHSSEDNEPSGFVMFYLNAPRLIVPNIKITQPGVPGVPRVPAVPALSSRVLLRLPFLIRSESLPFKLHVDKLLSFSTREI
jgi:hypothetical protein